MYPIIFNFDIITLEQNNESFMKSFAEIDIENKGNYLNLLSAISKLSGLFSESAVPFINYRVAENQAD